MNNNRFFRFLCGFSIGWTIVTILNLLTGTHEGAYIIAVDVVAVPLAVYGILNWKKL